MNKIINKQMNLLWLRACLKCRCHWSSTPGSLALLAQCKIPPLGSLNRGCVSALPAAPSLLSSCCLPTTTSLTQQISQAAVGMEVTPKSCEVVSGTPFFLVLESTAEEGTARAFLPGQKLQTALNIPGFLDFCLCLHEVIVRVAGPIQLLLFVLIFSFLYFNFF